eukprot:6132419-Lingulodinium_polyedra.AAC.1
MHSYCGSGFSKRVIHGNVVFVCGENARCSRTNVTMLVRGTEHSMSSTMSTTHAANSFGNDVGTLRRAKQRHTSKHVASVSAEAFGRCATKNFTTPTSSR